jgi:hypothetical protein
VLPHHDCVNNGQLVRLTLGIVRWSGARVGDRNYHEDYDLNHDGVIDALDLYDLLSMPSC